VELGYVRQEIWEAVAVAERNVGGKAISAGLALDDGRLSFVVVVVTGNDLHKVILDPPIDRPARPGRRGQR
jgi:hypothetical protein